MKDIMSVVPHVPDWVLTTYTTYSMYLVGRVGSVGGFGAGFGRQVTTTMLATTEPIGSLHCCRW